MSARSFALPWITLCVVIQYTVVNGLTNISMSNDDGGKKDVAAYYANRSALQRHVEDFKETKSAESSDLSSGNYSQHNSERKDPVALSGPECSVSYHKIQGGCPKDFWLLGETYCIRHVGLNFNWWQAVTECQRIGIQGWNRNIFLAQPQHRFGSEEMHRLWPSLQFWVGIYRTGRWNPFQFKEKRMNWKLSYYGLNDDRGGGAKCVVLRKVGSKIGYMDDSNCRDYHPFLCQAQRYWVSYDPKPDMKFTYQEGQRRGKNFVVVGDLISGTFEMTTSLLSDFSITLVTKKTNKHLIEYTFYRNYEKYFRPIRFVTDVGDHLVSNKTYITYSNMGSHLHPFCAATIKVSFKIRAQKYRDDDIEFRACPARQDNECWHFRTRRIFGGNLEVTFQPAFEELQKQFWKFMQMEQRMNCICRLGKSKKSYCSVRHLPHQKFTPPLTLPWEEHFYGNGTQMTVIGNQVPGLTFRMGEFGHSIEYGGYYIKVIITFGLKINLLSRSRISCQSHAEMADQDKLSNFKPLPHFNQKMTSSPLIVKFPPGEALLTVDWPGEPGVVWLGAPLKAHCKAYVGSPLPDANSMEWHVHRPTEGHTQTWRTFFGEPKDVEGIYRNVHTPSHWNCNDSEVLIYELGACVKVVYDVPLIWDDAQRYCRDKFNYGLASIASLKHFNDLKNIIHDDGFWVDVNDRATEGVYVQSDGSPVLQEYWYTEEAHEVVYRSLPHVRNCGALSKRGLETFNCRSRLQFLCQSPKSVVVSEKSYDREKGNFLTSTIEFTPDTSYEGATLRCRSFPHDLSLPREIQNLGDEDLFSSKSEPFVLKSGPLVQTITVVEKINGVGIEVTITCAALVGKDGYMSFTLMKNLKVNPRAKKLTWIMRGGKDEVHRMGGVQVKKIEDTENENTGHRVVSTMTILLSLEHHLTTIKCYPYDVENSGKVTSYLPKNKLHRSHVIDLRKPETLSVLEVERVFEREKGPDFNIFKYLELVEKDSQSEKKGSSLLWFQVVCLALVGMTVLGISCLKKDVNDMRKHKASQEQGGEYEKQQEQEKDEVVYVSNPSSIHSAHNSSGAVDADRRSISHSHSHL